MQWTCSERSGNIPGISREITFSEHSVNIQQIQGAFREYSGNIQRTFREHSANIHQTFTKYSPNIHQTFTKHLPNIHQTFTKHSPNIHQTFTKHSPNILQTFSKRYLRNHCRPRAGGAAVSARGPAIGRGSGREKHLRDLQHASGGGAAPHAPMEKFAKMHTQSAEGKEARMTYWFVKIHLKKSIRIHIKIHLKIHLKIHIHIHMKIHIKQHIK
jgi:hypothetical protein